MTDPIRTPYHCGICGEGVPCHGHEGLFRIARLLQGASQRVSREWLNLEMAEAVVRGLAGWLPGDRALFSIGYMSWIVTVVGVRPIQSAVDLYTLEHTGELGTARGDELQPL